MIVEKIMTKDVIALTPSDTIYSAVVLMKEKKIRHIPIVDKEFHLVGLVSDRNIRDASPSIFHTEEYSEDLIKPISSIMKTDTYYGSSTRFCRRSRGCFL